MLKEKILYGVLAVLFIAYVILEYYEPKPIDWTVTYAENDKSPFGSYILYDRLEDFYTEKEVSFSTLAEASVSSENIIILTDQFKPSQTDINALFSILKEGRSVLIGSRIFSEGFLDSLGIKWDFQMFRYQSLDTTEVIYNKEAVLIPESFVASTFVKDSINNFDAHATVDGQPVLISKNTGDGKLVITTLPQIFTNYSLLKSEHDDLASQMLKMLPESEVSYNRYYMSGRQEATTPLRYLLSVDSLRYATYLTVILLFIFLIVRSQRVQRPIPVLVKNVNTTIEFIKTIGGLYHREGDNKNAAMKIIGRFMRGIGTRYYIHTYDERGYKNLSSKSGVPLEDVINTFDMIAGIKAAPKISEEKLKELYKKINLFKIH